MKINIDEIQKLLKDNDISNIEELKEILGSALTDCDDDIAIDEKGYCLKAKCFNVSVPECRRIKEIHEKFYSSEIKEDFATRMHELLVYESKCDKSIKVKSVSTILRWLSCKGCNGLDNLKIKNGDFLDVLCNGLSIKLNQTDLFNENIKSVKKFKKNLIPSTLENFKPKLEKIKENENMKKQEKDRLYDMVHVLRSQLKSNLSDSKKTEGSDEYKMNLALYAFERNLNEESLSLLESLKESEEFKNDTTYLQLKAKILSNLEKDEEAIEVLTRLIDKQKPLIDTESYNLLAASIKRKALKEYFDVRSEYNNNLNFLKLELLKSKEVYSVIFHINKDYYPVLNIIYLNMMLVYIAGGDKNKIELEIKSAKDLWAQSNINNELKKNEWWSYISDIEVSILMRDYENVGKKIDAYLEDLNEEEISDFSISSTIRQMKLYREFCTDKELLDFIEILENTEKKKHLSKYVKVTNA